MASLMAGGLKALGGEAGWFAEAATREDALDRLCGLASVAAAAGRPLVLELDELVASSELAEGLKALINERPNGMVVVVAMIPEVAAELGRLDPPLADRLYKATLLCDLSHPRGPDEVWDVVREYLAAYGAAIDEAAERSLKALVARLYSEVGVRELRDVLAVMRGAMELARAEGRAELSEAHLAEAARRVRPARLLEPRAAAKPA